MSLVRCCCCDTYWRAESSPECPNCIAERWLADPSFLRQKHDPAALPYAVGSYRSVASHEVANNLPAYVHRLAQAGEWYWSPTHGRKVCVLYRQELPVPGSAVPPWEPMPSQALDAALIADASGSAHYYAESSAFFDGRKDKGDFVPLGICSVHGCDNLAACGEQRCVVHLRPPRALPCRDELS